MSRTDERKAAVPVDIVSFGYGHGDPPAAHLTVDVRGHFRDPHVDPALRCLTAADERVVRAVRGTPGVSDLVAGMQAAVEAFLAGPAPAPVTVAVGCAGGRHRSAVIAADLAARLRASGTLVTVAHRDIGRPVIERHRDAGGLAPLRAPGGRQVKSPAGERRQP